MDDDRILQGRYRLVAPVASGGMAEVWEGVDDVLTRPVAVKLLHPQLAADEDVRERFRREAVAAARLAHPNVVSTFDTGEEDGQPFIVMELVRGQTLRDLLDAGPIRPSVAAAIGVQVAEALDAAHRAGIVHRDVKPGNILLCEGTEPGAALSVKVADFGIARATSAGEATELTQPGTMLGTTKYLSPEQVQGLEPGPRADVYSLGVVLYEMVTGRPPFENDSPVATALAHVNTEPLRPRQRRAGIPRSLEAIVLKAMAKDPIDRFGSAAELAAALRAADLGTDDAVPAIVRDPTPPVAVASPFHQTERRWILPAVVIFVTALGLVLIALALSGSEVLDSVRPGDRALATVALASVTELDPTDGAERPEDVGGTIDGNPATSWRTSQYNSRNFGGLKDGLGLQIELAEPGAVRQVRVSSPTEGWSAQIFVADERSDDVADWGAPASERSDVPGVGTFDVEGRSGRFVLVWFTRLGTDNRVEVLDVSVSR